MYRRTDTNSIITLFYVYTVNGKILFRNVEKMSAESDRPEPEFVDLLRSP
jgi:hypothetical protein